MTTRTSRRAVLAGAITMPIAAAVVTVPALAETEVAELQGAEVQAAYDALGVVLDVPQAEQQSAEWRQREIDDERPTGRRDRRALRIPGAHLAWSDHQGTGR